MDNRFDHNDFEHFIKENADQYRMFPSEKVWKGIHKDLHTRRRWFGFGLSFLILTTVVVTWVMLGSSNKNRPVITSLPPFSAQQVLKEEKSPVKIILAPSKPSDNKMAFVTKDLQRDLFLQNDQSTESVPELANEVAVIAYAVNTPVFKDISNQEIGQVRVKPLSVPKQNIISKEPEITGIEHKGISAPLVSVTYNKEKEIQAIKEEITHARVNDYALTIESVINSYQFNRRKRKLSLELYITPSISYRELKENKPFIEWARNQANQSIGFTNPTYAADINSVVKHKPDIGLQGGISAGLPISKKVRFVAGLQFNVSKYDIRAYTHPTEMATISLTNISGGRSISAPSEYRNIGASEENWLRNLYISASIPVGLEVKLLGNRRTYFGVSSTIQPTYILSNKAYLLSTDYKNYAKIPSLTRRVNLNAGVEMFAGITTGKLKWRVGPQVRYQVMSSYQEKYPIKEHLFDFGLKMGIMLNH